MKDQEIYKKIGQILYQDSPNIENEVHLVGYIFGGSITTHTWFGNQGRIKENVFKLSRDYSMSVSDLLLDLNDYFVENNLGKWNVVYYKLLVKDNKFETEFEFSDGLANGTLPFWKYVYKFDPKI